ncbi:MULTISPECIES: SDR family oxidoreductase [Duganella]|uniref:NmrA family NAD(P)-binding protein n=2 Tax=Duganella TaxID=75654 RepID=A0A845GRY2_9BURK|nr:MULTISPECIES: NmrA family NAD(P)-binding protein [Duganella]MYM80764.1 NmrA family NAD(P)-binding protein [Duganella lactea]MYM96132.1 NmrA family NAD(P)-binding protein [Duganella vulcania]
MKQRILVTAGAGDQGRAATRHLIAAGHTVVAMDRLPADDHRPQELVALGAEYVQADLADEALVAKALTDVSVVFSVPVGPLDNEMAKVDNVAMLVKAAEKAGVEMFIQTSTAAAEYHIGVSDYGTGHTSDSYGTARLRLEALVRRSNIPQWVILRPVALMENFIAPKVRGMFPWLKDGRLDSVHEDYMPAQLVSVQDVAKFAVAIIADPSRFDHETIDLCGDELTMPEAALIFSTLTDKHVTHAHLSITQAIAAGLRPGVAHSQEWANRVGYHAPSAADTKARWGVEMTSFEQWALAHQNQIEVNQ